MPTSAELVASARGLIGVPWRHMGRTKQGVDCIGMILLAGWNIGVDFTSWARDRRYSREAAPDLLREVSLVCKPVPLELRVPGSMVCFRFPGERWPRHVALLTESETIVHSEMRKRAQVLEHGYRAQWVTTWTDSIWLLPGIDYSGAAE